MKKKEAIWCIKVHQLNTHSTSTTHQLKQQHQSHSFIGCWSCNCWCCYTYYFCCCCCCWWGCCCYCLLLIVIYNTYGCMYLKLLLLQQLFCVDCQNVTFSHDFDEIEVSCFNFFFSDFLIAIDRTFLYFFFRRVLLFLLNFLCGLVVLWSNGTTSMFDLCLRLGWVRFLISYYMYEFNSFNNPGKKNKCNCMLRQKV